MAPSERQNGSVSVEFALVSVVLFSLIFGTMELGRVFMVWNAAQEITRRAARDAAVDGFSALPYARNDAVLQPATSGNDATFPGLPELGAMAVSIQFMSGAFGALTPAAVLPTDGLQNQLNCAQGSTPCITAVQAMLCTPGSNPCSPIAYLPVGIPFLPMALFLPLSPVTLPLEGAGAH